MKPTDIVLGGAAWLALLVAVLILWDVPMARSQSRYDYDQGWVRGAIGHEHSKTIAEHEHRYHRPKPSYQSRYQPHYHAYRSHYTPRPRVVVVEKHYHDRDHDRRDHDRYDRDRYRDRYDRDRGGPRVYGWASQQRLQQPKCNGQCCDPVENVSRDHGTEHKAWADAVRGWSSAVSTVNGLMYADADHMDTRPEHGFVKQCFRGSYDESWLGRNKEALAQNTGTGTGYKIKCRIIARPCLAPTNQDGARDD